MVRPDASEAAWREMEGGGEGGREGRAERWRGGGGGREGGRKAGTLEGTKVRYSAGMIWSVSMLSRATKAFPLY
jgi:hypothetical protein